MVGTSWVPCVSPIPTLDAHISLSATTTMARAQLRCHMPLNVTTLPGDTSGAICPLPPPPYQDDILGNNVKDATSPCVTTTMTGVT